MSFDAFESSTEASRPIELYFFTVGISQYAYCSSEDPQTVGSITYAPLAISRGQIGLTQELRANILEITMPGTSPFPQLFTNTIPGQRARFTLKRFQRGDGGTPQVVTLFDGYVQSVAFTDQGKVAKVAVLPTSAALARQVPRFTYQGACNHVLADARCKVDENAFSFTGTVSAASGNTINVIGADAYPPGYFAAGRVDLTGATDSRLVLASVGTLLTLLLPFGTSPLGSVVTCFAGCAHDPTTCFTRFANTINYGGFPFVPLDNPFSDGL